MPDRPSAGQRHLPGEFPGGGTPVLQGALPAQQYRCSSHDTELVANTSRLGRGGSSYKRRCIATSEQSTACYWRALQLITQQPWPMPGVLWKKSLALLQS